MKPTVLACIFLSAMTLPLFGQLSDDLEAVDLLMAEEEYAQSLEKLQGLLARGRGDAAKAEVYWRMSMAAVLRSFQVEDDDRESALALLENGENYGKQARQLAPNDHRGYYWEASNISKAGLIRGVLDSLFRAGSVRDLLVDAIEIEPSHADSYYVLGRLYGALPGGIISFGNIEYAVSLSRYSVDLMEEQLASGELEVPRYTYYVELARHLWDRNWDQRARERGQDHQQYWGERAGNQLELARNYEGQITLVSMTDRDEALMIIEEALANLEEFGGIGLKDARELWNQWN